MQYLFYLVRRKVNLLFLCQKHLSLPIHIATPYNSVETVISKEIPSHNQNDQELLLHELVSLHDQLDLALTG